jgi:hypothetical protein
VVIVAMTEASDAAEALDATWCAVPDAAAEDLAGWDLVGASAEIRPQAA